MPVFDFSDTPVANEHPECTYETFHSTETKASADKPIVVIDNKQKEWAHHALGMFTNPIKRTSFEFEDSDGVTSADILRIDSRFVSLFKWLGENHIKVQLSGANTPDGYAVYKVREVALGRGTKLSAEDGFLQYMMERLFASTMPEDEPDLDDYEEEGDSMKLTSIQSITDFMTCAGRTLPDNILLWARRNLAVARSSVFGDIRKVFTDKKAITKDYVEALYDFLLQIHMYEKLEARKNELYEENRINEGDAYGQIFEKTVRLFDKIAELLGDTKMSVKEFYEIVDTGLSDIEVGVVPPTVDRVLIGDITRSRLNHIKVLFFTSVNDGIVPKAPKKGRILSDRDRDILSGCGLELAPSDKQNSYIEQFYIYTILTKPSDHLYISYHKLSASLESMRPSYLLGRISSIFPSLHLPGDGDS